MAYNRQMINNPRKRFKIKQKKKGRKKDQGGMQWYGNRRIIEKRTRKAWRMKTQNLPPNCFTINLVSVAIYISSQLIPAKEKKIQAPFTERDTLFPSTENLSLPSSCIQGKKSFEHAKRTIKNSLKRPNEWYLLPKDTTRLHWEGMSANENVLYLALQTTKSLFFSEITQKIWWLFIN